MTPCIIMANSATKQGGKKKILKRLLLQLIGVLILLGLWQFSTLFFSPMVVPPIQTVAVRLVEIVGDSTFFPTVLTTLLRLLAGLAIGLGIGLLMGLLFGLCKPVENLFSPVIRVLQSVPPVCWVVLALVWFGFNGKPCVFIVATATIPTVVINLCNGVRNIDPDLLEMAKLYRFSRWKVFRHVIFPSVRPYFRSALEIVIGGSWKLVVMGEVLTTSSGIGGMITTARLNIEPDAIIAWALLLVIFCYITQKLIQLILFHRRFGIC